MEARTFMGLAGILIALSTVGCVRGLLYTHVTVPLDVGFDRTPVYEDRSPAVGQESTKTLRYYVQIEWGSTGPGDVAKKYGFKKIYYADLETRSILGYWTQRTAHVYGER